MSTDPYSPTRPSIKMINNFFPLIDTEWALTSNKKNTKKKGKISLYKQTIQLNKDRWFKLYIPKEHLAFNSIYYCQIFNYFGKIEVLQMARNIEGVYRTLNFKMIDNQLLIPSNQIIMDMHLDEQLLFFCVQSLEEAAFEIEVFCRYL